MPEIGYGFPSVKAFRIASASGSVSGSLLISSTSFSPTVNVEVGDVVIFNVRLSGTTGAAAGTYLVGFTKVGTASLEFAASSLGVVMFSSDAVTASIAISNCYTLKYRVTAAGTFAGIGSGSNTLYGTAMTSLSTEHQTEVWRVARLEYVD